MADESSNGWVCPHGVTKCELCAQYHEWVDPQLERLGREMEVNVRLRAALNDVMPLLAECDCIHSDRTDMLCPCKAARAALSGASPLCAVCDHIEALHIQAGSSHAFVPKGPADETKECPHCREVYEIWAGSDGMVPETAPETYQKRLIHQMRDAAARGLAQKASEKP